MKGSAAAILVGLCLVLLVTVGTTSCLVRRRVITRKGGKPTQTLLTANRETLLRGVVERFNSIQSLNATVDMAPALGTANKGRITEYKDVRAYVLFRKPGSIRIIGLYPFLRTSAFDMVSDGIEFRLYIPSKNRFIMGENRIEKLSPNKLENLRPQAFVEALLVNPVDTEREQTILENFTDEDNASYILSIITPGPGGQPVLERQLWFERLRLLLVRQMIFDSAGDIITDARYSNWQIYDNVPFPKTIDLERPKDEYGVVMTVVKMDINKPVTDDKFHLEQPEGSELRILGRDTPPAEAAPKPSPTPASKKGKKNK